MTQKKLKPKRKKTSPAPKSPKRTRRTTPGARAKITASPDKRQDALRLILLGKRKEVLRDLEEHLGKHLKGALPSRENEVLDSGDQATQDVSEDMNLSFQERRTQTLKLIDEALQRLEDKTYGICDECGDNIPEPRLGALPFAKFCISCQERQETLDKIEREEDRFK